MSFDTEYEFDQLSPDGQEMVRTFLEAVYDGAPPSELSPLPIDARRGWEVGLLANLAEEADSNLDAFVEAHYYFEIWRIEESSNAEPTVGEMSLLADYLTTRYFLQCSVDRLLEAHAQYHSTWVGMSYVDEIIYVLIEKLLIDDRDEDSVTMLEGLVRQGNPNWHHSDPQTVYDLTEHIVTLMLETLKPSDWGNRNPDLVYRLVEGLIERFPQRKKLAFKALMEVLPERRASAWRSATR